MEAAAITMELANLAGERFFPISSDKSSVGRRAAMETLIYYIIMRLADRAGIRAARDRIGSSAARELPEERRCLPSSRQRLLSSDPGPSRSCPRGSDPCLSSWVPVAFPWGSLLVNGGGPGLRPGNREWAVDRDAPIALRRMGIQ